jgi:hypothetical protein
LVLNVAQRLLSIVLEGFDDGRCFATLAMTVDEDEKRDEQAGNGLEVEDPMMLAKGDLTEVVCHEGSDGTFAEIAPKDGADEALLIAAHFREEKVAAEVELHGGLFLPSGLEVIKGHGFVLSSAQ